MTIQIELDSEIMERLAKEAEAQGLALQQYAERLLREAVANAPASDGQLSVQELRAMLNDIADGSEKLPKLPTAAFDRENFYEETR